MLRPAAAIRHQAAAATAELGNQKIKIIIWLSFSYHDIVVTNDNRWKIISGIITHGSAIYTIIVVVH